MASLQKNDLDTAAVGTLVADKFGVKWFKMADGLWASDALDVTDSAQLSKRRPVRSN